MYASTYIKTIEPRRPLITKGSRSSLGVFVLFVTLWFNSGFLRPSNWSHAQRTTFIIFQYRSLVTI